MARTLNSIVYFSGLILFGVIWIAPLYAAEVLVLNITGNPPLNTPEQTGFVDQIAGEAFRRIGLQLKTVRLPAERGLKNANAGIDDGDMLRIDGLEKLYPNLIMVPEKIMEWEFYGFSNKNIDPEGKWENLKPYTVSFLIGWKILEKNVPEEAEITKVKNLKQLFGLLEKKRTDLIIYERWGGLKYIKQNNLSDIKLLGWPLAVRNMYIYLNKKHRDLVPKLAESLREMKRDGSYQLIYRRVLAPFAGK